MSEKCSFISDESALPRTGTQLRAGRSCLASYMLASTSNWSRLPIQLSRLFGTAPSGYDQAHQAQPLL